jgi:hypothetical protein
MRKNLVFILISLTFWSFTKHGVITPNANTWNVRIGDSLIMASWLNNKMGDTGVVNLNLFAHSDTIYATRNLCGYAGYGDDIATLTIKNIDNQIICESNNTRNIWSFDAKLPLSEIFNSNKFKKGQMVKVYFTMDFVKKEERDIVLLCYIRFQ